MKASYERRTLVKFADKKRVLANTRETDKPRRRGLCTSSIQSKLPLPFTSIPNETFPSSSIHSTTNHTSTSTTTTPLNNKLTSRTKVIFPTRNISKWSQITNGGTFAHSISNLLEKTRNKLSLKELSPHGQIHFVNMMNRDLTLMQTIELYTALTPHKFTLAYRLKFNVQPNGVYINFSMSQSNANSVSTQPMNLSESTTTTTEITPSNNSSITNTNTNININTTTITPNASQSIMTTRQGWALFQISREKDSNNSILPNKIIEVAILM